jgi:predicted nucleic acid-binding protein
MILVDTNIIIDFWINPEQEKTDIFNNNKVAICPVVMAELIHGAKSEKQKARIKEALSELHMLSINEDTWDFFGDLLYKLRTSGVTVPFQDALVAAVAIKNNCLLWTDDKHFPMISNAIDDLKLFEIK